MNRELLKKAIEGDELSISRILTKIEYFSEEGMEYLEELSARAGRAYTIGITGSPGAGKSTLISTLIDHYTKEGLKVGVVMVDPSSPFSKGSFMGNRIRMQDKTMNKNVFIRSLASRGFLGGVSAEAIMLIEALDGLGFDRIILETVGSGQTDTDVVSVVHSILVLAIPGSGDEIQALKAGIMEIGDFYVVNKADKPEAEALYDSIKFAIESGETFWRDGWKPQVVKVSALKGMGIEELTKRLREHEEFVKSRGLFEKRVIERRHKLIELYLRRKLEAVLEETLKENRTVLSEYESKGINLNKAIREVYERFKQRI
ncbi:MAG: methylmalonyl Co-A mutase-associated GTPase MeaB [Candidatus Aramenus sp.]|nr:methylmalonyl Co-A mutase-associated GTPase MeaB [Candidatus Aramenus sp.]